MPLVFVDKDGNEVEAGDPKSAFQIEKDDLKTFKESRSPVAVQEQAPPEPKPAEEPAEEEPEEVEEPDDDDDEPKAEPAQANKARRGAQNKGR